MSNVSRRKLITTGLAATAGASGLAVAHSLAKRYGLIPPDHGGIYGLGETLTYASQRLLTRHSLAREFPRSQISKAPFANGKPPKDEAFRRLQEGAFAGWRLTVDGMVARPASFTVADLKSYPSRSQITHLPCEEGWSFNRRMGRSASIPCFGACRHPATSQIRCVLLDGTRLVGQHRHGRCLASADVHHVRDEWR
jgi:DMSO/TMAO reductase YedYZ molybdopterin-dependent catalytic subunit